MKNEKEVVSQEAKTKEKVITPEMEKGSTDATEMAGQWDFHKVRTLARNDIKSAIAFLSAVESDSDMFDKLCEIIQQRLNSKK